MLEAFRQQNNFFIVYVYHKFTLLDRLNSGMMPYNLVRGYTLQLTRALEFLHSRFIVHRDLKPENIIVTENNVIKLKNFNSARYLVPHLCPFTQYVSSRWYRAPELLLSSDRYDSSIDIWALGCIVMEMENKEPLFPGESDIDQLSLITRYCGWLTKTQMKRLGDFLTGKEQKGVIKIFFDPPQFYTLVYILCCKYPSCDRNAISFTNDCLKLNPEERFTAEQLMKHDYLNEDNFAEAYLENLKRKVLRETEINTILKNAIRRYKLPKYQLSGFHYLTRPCETFPEENQYVIGEVGEEEEIAFEREILDEMLEEMTTEEEEEEMSEEEMMTEEEMIQEEEFLHEEEEEEEEVLEAPSLPEEKMMAEEEMVAKEEVVAEEKMSHEETRETTEESEEESELEDSEEESTKSSTDTLPSTLIENIYYQLGESSISRKLDEKSIQLLKVKPVSSDSQDLVGKNKIDVQFKQNMLPPTRFLRKVGLNLIENELSIKQCFRNLLRCPDEEDTRLLDLQRMSSRNEDNQKSSEQEESCIDCSKSINREQKIEDYIEKELRVPFKK
ncbi:uncharacterized protein isoform X2 [Rhodnius prolixus]